MVVLFRLLYQFRIQKVVRNGDDHAILVASVSEAGTDQYVCGSSVHEDRPLVPLLGSGPSAARTSISSFHKLRARETV